MTIETEGDQIVLTILAGVAAKFFMVNFKVCHRTAELAAPAVSPQYLLAKFPVAFLLEPNRCLLGNNVIHWTESWPSQVWAAPATYGRTVPLSNSLAGYLS